MADDADRAAEIAARMDTGRPVAAIRGRLLQPGRTICLDCGEAIPAERLAAYSAAERCIGCQTELEETER